MSEYLSSFLISGARYVALCVPAEKLIRVILEGGGPYYGVSWSGSEIFILDRNRGKGELIHCFDSQLRPTRVLEVGRNIDGHQILFFKNCLFVTATRENALYVLKSDSSVFERWNWTAYDYDVNHINGLYGNMSTGMLMVSHDNKKGTRSEIVQVDPASRSLLSSVAIGVASSGSHNIERDLVLTSDDCSQVWAEGEGGAYELLWNCEQVFFRGLAFDDSPRWRELVLIGGSPVLERGARGLPNCGVVYVCQRHPFKPCETIDIPEIGQVHDVRTLNSLFVHNGISWPAGSLRLNGLRSIKL